MHSSRSAGSRGDHFALARRLGIAGRRHDDAERGTPVPFGLDLVEPAVDGGLQQSHQVGLQPHHDRLRFRIAHAAIELERLGTAGAVDHQARVEKTGERDAVGGHAVDRSRWMISRSTRAWIVGVTTGAGEYAPMPPVFGPRSPSSRRL